MEKLRESGYDKGFKNLEEGVRDYVLNYLDKFFDIYWLYRKKIIFFKFLNYEKHRG